jgi:hypothetical protein
MGKKKQESLFLGLWHIVSMTGWDEQFVSAEVQAFIEFDENGTGAFEFAYIRATIDYRLAEREGMPAVEFSWSGVADTAQVCGRGWAVLSGDELKGRIFFHLGDESGFVARRVPTRKRTKRQ